MLLRVLASECSCLRDERPQFLSLLITSSHPGIQPLRASGRESEIEREKERAGGRERERE